MALPSDIPGIFGPLLKSFPNVGIFSSIGLPVELGCSEFRVLSPALNSFLKFLAHPFRLGAHPGYLLTNLLRHRIYQALLFPAASYPE